MFPYYQQGTIWVSGEKEASIYPVAPNNSVTLWDSEAPVIYLKKADASGKPSLQVFDLVERAPKEEEDITKALAEIRAELASLKDIYGKKEDHE